MKIEVQASRALIEGDTGVVAENGAITWTERRAVGSNPTHVSQDADGLGTCVPSCLAFSVGKLVVAPSAQPPPRAGPQSIVAASACERPPASWRDVHLRPRHRLARVPARLTLL